MKSPFRYFKTSPEIIRLAVMMYVRFPLSLLTLRSERYYRTLMTWLFALSATGDCAD